MEFLPRAAIVKVGAVDRLEDGKVILQGWSFYAPTLDKSCYEPETFFGWTLQDLADFSTLQMELAKL